MPIRSWPDPLHVPGWVYPAIIGLTGSMVLGVMSAPPPRAGEVAGAFMPWGAERALVAMLEADPDLRLVDRRWGGRVIFVVFRRRDFPAAVRRTGTIMMFDAKGVGCGF